MDGKKLLYYQKSPSRASRVVCETLNSEKLVWLAPVSSPLRSPAREKTQMARRKTKQGSIFALPRRAKVSIEAEEPTSPKVSCIGQVRASKKSHGSFADSKTEKSQYYKPVFASPARFFTSPGRQSKWGSLFGSRRDALYAASSSPGEVSCFGFSCNSTPAYNPETSCGAFFAKSLILLQECGERAEYSKSEVLQMHAHAQQTHAHAHALNGVVEKQSKLTVSIPSEQSACSRRNADVLCVAQTSSEPTCKVPQQKEPHAHDDKHAHENPCNGFLGPVIPAADAEKHVPLALSSEEHRQQRGFDSCDAEKDIPLASSLEEQQQESTSGFTQTPTYEELPSLHCSGYNKQNLKISVEVVPETWICGDHENSKANSPSLLNGVCEGLMGSSGEELREVQGEFSSTCEAADYARHHVSSCQSQFKATELAASNVKTPEDDIICKAFEGEDSSCISMCALKEEENACSNLEDLESTHERDPQGYDLRRCEEQLDTIHVIDDVLSSNNGCDTNNQSYSLPLPQLVEKNLHAFHLGKETDCVWNMRQGKQNEASSAQAFSTLIFLEYNLSQDFVCFKDGRDKIATCEVAKVSFHGAGRQLQWLKGEAEFIRSRSATSYRTVIRLERCKSEPGRSY